MDTIPQETPQKQCSDCKQIKPATRDFFNVGKGAQGLRQPCRICRHADHAAKHPKPHIPQGMKQCTVCKQLLPATLNYFGAQKRDGLRSHCKECRKKDYREHREENLQRSKEYQRKTNYSSLYSKSSRGKEVSRRYYMRHREQVSRYNKERYDRTKETRRAHARRYARIHRDEIRQRKHVRRQDPIYLKNVRAMWREYAAKNQVTRRAIEENRRSRKMNAKGTFTANDIEKQYTNQKGKCYYCRVKVGKVYHVDHVIPLSRGGSNDISNLVISCPPCNMKKHDKLPHEWPEGNRLM